MKKVFVDTNIIVDLLADRPPFSKFARPTPTRHAKMKNPNAVTFYKFFFLSILLQLIFRRVVTVLWGGDYELFFSLKHLYLNLVLILFLDSWTYLFVIGLFAVLFREKRNFLILKILYITAASLSQAFIFDNDGWVFSQTVMLSKIPKVLPHILTGLSLLRIWQRSLMRQSNWN